MIIPRLSMKSFSFPYLKYDLKFSLSITLTFLISMMSFLHSLLLQKQLFWDLSKVPEHPS